MSKIYKLPKFSHEIKIEFNGSNDLINTYMKFVQ